MGGDSELVRRTLGERYASALDAQVAAIRGVQDPRSAAPLASALEEYGLDAERERPAIVDALRRAATFYVTGQMCQVVDQARRSMPHLPLHPGHLPAPIGFIWFEVPYESRAPGGVGVDRHVARGVLWQATAKGVRLLEFTDPSAWDAAHRAEVATQVRLAALPAVPLTIYEQWWWGDTWADAPEVDLGGHDVAALDWNLVDRARERVLTLRSTLTAAWALMHQPLGRPARVSQRAAARRARRVLDGDDAGGVRVVLLRRQVPRDPDREDADAAVDVPRWTHRWVVSGHWRRQWYPSEGTHRLVWIDPHVKGPDDKPLRVSPTVNVLGR